jgi:hypothetical protein
MAKIPRAKRVQRNTRPLDRRKRQQRFADDEAEEEVLPTWAIGTQDETK